MAAETRACVRPVLKPIPIPIPRPRSRQAPRPRGRDARLRSQARRPDVGGGPEPEAPRGRLGWTHAEAVSRCLRPLPTGSSLGGLDSADRAEVRPGSGRVDHQRRRCELDGPDSGERMQPIDGQPLPGGPSQPARVRCPGRSGAGERGGFCEGTDSRPCAPGRHVLDGCRSRRAGRCLQRTIRRTGQDARARWIALG